MKTIKVLLLLTGLSISSMGFGSAAHEADSNIPLSPSYLPLDEIPSSPFCPTPPGTPSNDTLDVLAQKVSSGYDSDCSLTSTSSPNKISAYSLL